MKRYIDILLILLFLAPTFLFSQSKNTFPEFEDVKKVAQTGYQFLKIGVGTQGPARGGAAITMEGDAFNIFWNPAGIASVTNRSVFVGYTNWFADITHQAVAAAVNLRQFGVVGISAINMNHGDIMGTQIANNNIGYTDTGILDVGELAIGLTYARRFTDKFGLGVTAKYCSQNLDAMSSNIMAFDIGTIYNTGWKSVKIAMSIQHFSKEVKYITENFELPLTYRVGLSADVLALMGQSSNVHQWTIALEGVNPRDYTERVHVGMEYWFNNLVALRGGYKFNYDEESVSLGAGFKVMGVQVGYSYSDFGAILGTINRVSAQVNF